MRLVTFNILHGRDPSDGDVHLDRLVAAVRALDPDVLALQEVDQLQPRSGAADLTAVAAEAMGAVSMTFVPTISGLLGKGQARAEQGAEPESPGYGIALLSRYPVRRWDRCRLPRCPLRIPVWRPATREVAMVEDEPRGVLVAEIDTPHGPLVVANTHLSLWPGWRWAQVAVIARRLRRYPDPVVLMGDLNMGAAGLERLTTFISLARLPTVPVDDPVRQIDHILARGPLGRVTAREAIAQPLSDHRPLAVEVTI